MVLMSPVPKRLGAGDVGDGDGVGDGEGGVDGAGGDGGDAATEPSCYPSPPLRPPWGGRSDRKGGRGLKEALAARQPVPPSLDGGGDEPFPNRTTREMTQPVGRRVSG